MAQAKTPKYNVVVDILNEKFEGSGKTIEEALENVDISWKEIKGNGEITVSKGNNKFTHLFNRPSMVRIFSNKNTRMQQAKRFELLLPMSKESNKPE